LRILFVTKPHLQRIGGAQLTTHALASALSRRGHEIIALAAFGDAPVAGQEPVGLDPSTLSYPVCQSHDTAGALPALLEETAPAAVVVDDRGSLASVTREVLQAVRDFPTIMHLHALGSEGVAADPDVRPDLVVAVSNYLARATRAHGAADVAVVPPAIDAERLIPPPTRRVALFASLARHKGSETVLALARARPDVRFAVVRTNHPAERDHVAHAAEQIAGLPNVELRPETSDPRDLYRDARVVLVPSIQPEGFGRVAAEADICGIPVVAARIGGLGEAAGSGALFVEPNAGLDEWQRALAAVLDDPAEYARRARPTQRPELHPDVAAATWEHHIATAVTRRRELRSSQVTTASGNA
jgi:glycosyltransferase involved in cell wall biosynthesis